MALTKNAGRQATEIAYVDIAFGDLVSGTAAAVIDLPVGAVVCGGAVTVDTAYNSGTSDVLVVGDATTSNRYKSSYSIAATGRTALVPTGYQTLSTTNQVKVTWTAVGTAATAGAFTVEVHYYVRKRASHSQG